MKYLFSLILLFPLFLFSQQSSFHDDYKFGEHLLGQKNYIDANYFLASLDTSRLQRSSLDSLYHLLGSVSFAVKSLDSSIYWLDKISDDSPFSMKGIYYSSFSLSYLGNPSGAISRIREVEAEGEMADLKNFQLAGHYLLNRDLKGFDSLRPFLENQNFYATTREARNLIVLREEIGRMKRRSPVTAGLLSSVVPGSGKYYAGFKAQGLSAFITCVSLGAVAGELLYREGPKNAGFIAAASVFTIFYVGNIWGSVLSVKIRRDEINADINNSIYVDLHVPLLRVYK